MFIRLVREELKRAVFNWGTLAVIIVLFFMSIISIRWGAHYQNGYEILFFGPSKSSIRDFFMLFCVVPYAFCYCDEYNTGYRNYMLVRAGYKKYAWSKVIAVAVSGAVPLMVWHILFYITCMVIHGPVSLSAPEFSGLVSEFFTSWKEIFPETFSLLESSKAIFYELLTLLIIGVNGALWASVGLAISSFFTNRYIVLAAPFVLATATTQLLKYSRFAYFSPGFFFEARFWFMYPTVLFEILILLIASWYIFYTRGKEVLKNA